MFRISGRIPSLLITAAIFYSWIASESLASVVSPQANSGGASPKSDTGISAPKDLRFLEDLIELSVKVPNRQDVFSVNTRPGQMIRISIPVGSPGGEIFTYGFIFHPEYMGGPAMDHEKVHGIDVNQQKFVMVPLCLEMYHPEIAITGSGAAVENSEKCASRSRFGQLRDEVRVMASYTKAGIGKNSPFVDPVSGVEFAVKDYRHLVAQPISRKFGPWAKCCMPSEGVEVCACKVELGSSVQSCGCD